MDDGRSNAATQTPGEASPATASPGDNVSNPATCLLRIRGYTTTTIWGLPTCLTIPDTEPQARLCLQPDEVAVVGRQEGGPLEYLDPAYRPTRIEPAVGRPILCGSDRDVYVSRGHFMLRGTTQGILLVNGVPRRGGGIRPPVNGTRLLEPASRRLDPGEEYLIERGESATFLLPNGTEISVRPM